jgi:hypothetical protein
MLPETLAPAAEILLSVTVSVELAEGSQLPVFVTMVTFQTPSNGCWARADVLMVVATPKAKPRIEKAVPMRVRRINQFLDVGEMGGGFGRTSYVQNLLRRSITNCSCNAKHMDVNLVPSQEQRWAPD